MRIRVSQLTIITILIWMAAVACHPRFANAQLATDSARPMLESSLKSLHAKLDELRTAAAPDIADAAIFAKGLDWALSYDRDFSPADIALMQKAAERCQSRVAAIVEKRPLWKSRHGKVALGYVSAVDGSVQPYGLIVPKKYDGSHAIRLDVVLHGSTRPVGLSELRFVQRFDEGDAENNSPPDAPYIELHPLGRVENCYRWAGETDVFEAIEDVCRRYKIDCDRIVLRGMSMGASGTWHLGLKHPDRFVALGPYCGYVDTHRFSETPLANFVKVGSLPEHQELGLHMLDSIDYAANAGVVPAIACMGEKDVFFDAHVLMGQAMQREGLTMVNLISPGTGHVIDPVTHAEQMRRIAKYCDKGLNHRPRDIRFVTWTLKYSKCHWLQIQGLERHYARAEIAGRIKDDLIEIDEPRNVTRFAILAADLSPAQKSVLVGKKSFDVSSHSGTELVFANGSQGWQFLADPAKHPETGKRPGLQGPIDDAFTTPFLCVRGTGTPWNPAAQQYAVASLKRFADEWRHYFRGELPVKKDSEVTDEDVRTRNLILFGDPGSNSWIAKTQPGLPFSWTRETVSLGGKEYSAAGHVPALIAPNPLPAGAGRYVVLNSGHTFREAELAKLNYLLFPRWGDWAVLEIPSQTNPSEPVSEKILQAGYFNEQWQMP